MDHSEANNYKRQNVVLHKTILSSAICSYSLLLCGQVISPF